MYTRVITLTGVNDVDAAVSVLRDALPVVQSQRGYQGMTASADRAGGVVGILSLWETEADRDASESALAKTRDEARAQLSAAAMTVEAFEERVVELSRPPELGSPLMVTRISMDPAKVDENIEFFKREIAPQIAAAPGFRALRNMINPETGEGIVGSIWDDEPSMQAAAEAAQTRRSEATKRGVSFDEMSFREILFIDLK
jgi:heme-degrading monooxygenase HmoA